MISDAMGATATPTRRHSGRLLSALFSLLLAACATSPKAPWELPDSWAEHRASLMGLEHWELRGKLGYRGLDANGSAWLTWRQDEQDFDLTLSGPLGAGSTRISGHPELAVLNRGHEEIRADSPSALTYEALGTHLPLQELPWWVRGLPSPGRYESLTLDHNHLLAELEQSGWQLRFDRHVSVDGYLLPGRIIGAGTGNNQDLGFTLVINQWQPQSTRDERNEAAP